MKWEMKQSQAIGFGKSRRYVIKFVDLLDGSRLSIRSLPTSYGTC
jgi:hypothetical protein